MKSVDEEAVQVHAVGRAKHCRMTAQNAQRTAVLCNAVLCLLMA